MGLAVDCDLAQETEPIARWLAAYHPDPEVRRVYRERAERAGGEAKRGGAP